MTYSEINENVMNESMERTEEVGGKEIVLNERQKAILALAKEGVKISTSLIQRKYSVGYGTASKDIQFLCDNGLLSNSDIASFSYEFFKKKKLSAESEEIKAEAPVESEKSKDDVSEKNDKLLVEERHRAILDIISDKGSITTSMIQLKFGVGYDTAKRDLRLLEEKGLLKRTHGGAVPVKQIGFRPEGIHALSSKDRCAVVDEKYMKIARAAVKLIEHNDVIFITAASIGYLMAKAIREGGLEGKFCSVVTNSSTVAEELRGVASVRVFVTGGEMKENGNFYDDFALSMIERMRFDKYFITSASCSASFGLSIQGENSIIVSKAVLKNTRRVIGLYPSAKIGNDSIIQICPIDKVDVLITDDGIPEETLAEFRELGVDAVIA